MAVERTFGPTDGKNLPCLDGAARTEYIERETQLRLRVTRDGARAWSVVYWSPVSKQSRRYKIGDAARMSLALARAAARKAITSVDDGGDPYAERVARRVHDREERQRRAEERRRATADRARRSVSFGELCEKYVEYRRTTPEGRYKRKARPNTLAVWRGMLKNYIIPAIGDRPPEDLTSEDFLNVLETAVKKGGPSMGPRVRELLSAVWGWIVQRPRSLGVKLPAVSPMTALPKVGSAAKERERTLSPAEIWRFWRATEEEALKGEALRFSLLTAARVREATDLPWSEVDLAAKVWKLPAARNKSGRDRMIPLSDAAVHLLQRVAGAGTTAWAFGEPGRFEDAVRRARERMGGEHWEPRDLRRTAATLCAVLGADPFVVALALGHATVDARVPDVTGTYNRWKYEPKVREAFDRLGSWVEDTVSRESEPGGDVVSITSSARA